MEMQGQSIGNKATAIAAEMLALTLQAFVAGIAAALLAGSLVVAVTVIAT